MAISSIGSAFGGGTSTAAVDVADIVSRLMSAENRPLDAINQKIASKKLVISELGVIKTKVATFQDAVTVFENPNTYMNTSATSDSTKVLNVSASNTASVGSYVVNVSQVAQRSLYNITGFASTTDLLRTTSNNGFQMTVGNTIYSSNGSKTVNGVTIENAITAIGTSPTAESLKNWINNLRSVTQVSATLAQMDNNQWALFISGDNEGANYDFSITGLQTDLVISGFDSENDVVSLDVTNGFSLTHNGITYKTSGAGANVSVITGTGSNGAILLKDIKTWIENLSSTNNLNLIATISNGELKIVQDSGNGSVINVGGLSRSTSVTTTTTGSLELISSTQRQRDESALVAFSSLKTGDSLTIAGLTMTAKQDLTSTEAATVFNTMRNGASPGVISSITNGIRSNAVSGRATIEISNVTLPTTVGTYKLTSLGSVLTMTKYVNNVATNSSSINIITSGSSNPSASPPTVLFQSALNGQTDLNFGALGSFSVNTVLAATSAETTAEIASKILNAVNSTSDVTGGGVWVSVPDADWANTAKTNLGGTDSYKVVITTTGNTLIRIAASTTTSLGAVTGYTGLAGMDDGLVTEMAFTGTAAQLSAALKTLEAKSADGLGKVAVHIVPSNISVRVDSVTGSISYYKRVATSLNASNAQIAAKSIANRIVTPDGSLTGYLSNVTSAAETTFMQQKGVVGSNSWIGLSDVAVEGQWRWLDGPEAGALSTYFNWNSGEPNNSGNEDYVHLRSDYKWNDATVGSGFPYVVEYSAAANSTLLRRELSPSKGIISITDPNIATALNNATFSGTVSGYTTSLNGSQLTFTSTQPLTNVPNISYSFTTAADPPSVFAAPVINEGGSSLATALLEFPAGGLQTGDTITVSGLTFTASRATSATELATAFASLIDSATTGAGTSYGSYSGSLTGFTSGPLVSTNRVLFTQVDSGVANSIASTAIITTTATTLVAATITGTGLTVDKFTTAQDALFTVDDKSYTKTTNTVGDVISGLTLQLTGDAGIANVSVVLGEDKSEVSIKSFMTAYNDLIKATNTMNANSSNSEKPGTFANSPTSLSFISDIKRKVADGATYNIGKTDSTGRPYTMSLSSLGLDYQRDGTLLYNAASLASAKSQGLRDKLLSGLRIGYSSSADNLADLLKSQMSSIGVLTNQTSSGAESLSSLNKEKDRLEERLNKIKAGHIAQYSNLNKLLFQLNSTSQSLTSALDGLKNA